MLAIQIATEYLDLQDISCSITLKNPIFNKEDGSYIFDFEVPATDKNKRILGFPGRIESFGRMTSEMECQLFLSGLFWDNGLCKATLASVANTSVGSPLRSLSAVEGGTITLSIGLGKGSFNYMADQKKLTELTYPAETWRRVPANQPGSIFRVLKKKFPEEKFAYFPVYNPGLYRDTWFADKYVFSANSFLSIVAQLHVWDPVQNVTIDLRQFYYTNLRNEGHIAGYWDIDGYHDEVQDHDNKVNLYFTQEDRYSGEWDARPDWVFVFWRELIRLVYLNNIQSLFFPMILWYNEFCQNGWVNWMQSDFNFNDPAQIIPNFADYLPNYNTATGYWDIFTFSPGRFIVPFPYLCEIIRKSITELGFFEGKNFFYSDAELRTLVIMTMNLAYGYHCDPQNPDFTIKLNEHLPELSTLQFLQALEKFFNATIIVNRDRSIDIIRNEDILTNPAFIDWSSGFIYKETSLLENIAGFEIVNSIDEFWNSTVKQEGIAKYTSIPSVWSVADLPDPNINIRRINVLCYVQEKDAWYATAAKDATTIWKPFSRNNFDYVVSGAVGNQKQSADIGYFLKTYGSYFNNNQWKLYQPAPGLPFHWIWYQRANFCFPRCDFRGNSITHDISFDTEYNPMEELKLMFYRGEFPMRDYTNQSVNSPIVFPYGSADDKYWYDTISGVRYSLKWEGENGIINRFWKKWLYWYNHKTKPVTGRKQLAPADLVNLSWASKHRIAGLDYFIKEIRVNIQNNHLSPAEIDLLLA